MPQPLPAGPYRTIQSSDGHTFPYYIIPFDKRGHCKGPQTRAHLIDAARNDGFTDVFIFSHGWNNDWSTATGRYEDFMNGYMNMRATHNLPVPDNFKPLLVGVFWPSTALVLGRKERGPAMAAGDIDQLVDEQLADVETLADAVAPDQAEKMYGLLQQAHLDEDAALELAKILMPIYASADDELGGDNVTPETLVAGWAETQLAHEADSADESDDLDDFGTVDDASTADVQAAGLGSILKKLDPRNIVRTTTVYMMKDRAGVVGARGVGSLLRDLLNAGDARVHLAGHSYGAKIVLSATAADTLPRSVESMLLLQPAVSHLCFADTVPGTQRSGGYRHVLERVKKPIMSTFSRHDFPLTKTFHLALRRKKDLGEVQIAGGSTPSRYAALGGFGPRESGEQLIAIRQPNDAYALDPAAPIYGLNGDGVIKGHGDISNEATWWAMYWLAMRA